MNAPADDPARQREAALWLEKAAVDLRAVRALLDLRPPLIDPASFHCQQAAEKFAKCLLVSSGREAPHIHDIETLGGAVRAVFPELGLLIESVSEITAWYFSARYPDVAADIVPSVSDIEVALTKLQNLHRKIAVLIAESR